jgi:hypothetical protein
MKKRGVKRIRCSTPYELNDKNFDTIILLGCAIAFVEHLDGLKKFLIFAKTLLNKDGIIIMDSRDVRLTDNPRHIEYQERNIKSGKYRGEIRLQISFKGEKGEIFQILHIDPDTLKRVAKSVDWDCEISIAQDEQGLYLAKLKLSP